MPKPLKNITVLFDFLEKNSFHQSKESIKSSQIIPENEGKLIEEYKKETGRRTTKYRGKNTNDFEEWKKKRLKKVRKEIKKGIPKKPKETITKEEEKRFQKEYKKFKEEKRLENIKEEKEKEEKEKIISKEWDLSIKRFKSTAEQRSAIEDINFIFENMIFFFSQREKLEYGYLEEEQKYQIKYIPDKVNDFLVSELDKLIERRIKEKISLTTLTSNLSSLMDKTEKIEPKEKFKPKEKPKKEEIKKVLKNVYNEDYINDFEIRDILKIYNALSNEEKSRLLDYLKIELIGDAEGILKLLQHLTSELKIDLVNKRFYELRNREAFWNERDSYERRWFLTRIGRYQKIPDKILVSKWKELPFATQSRIEKNLKDFKTLLIKYRFEEKVEFKKEFIDLDLKALPEFWDSLSPNHKIRLGMIFGLSDKAELTQNWEKHYYKDDLKTYFTHLKRLTKGLNYTLSEQNEVKTIRMGDWWNNLSKKDRNSVLRMFADILGIDNDDIAEYQLKEWSELEAEHHPIISDDLMHSLVTIKNLILTYRKPKKYTSYNEDYITDTEIADISKIYDALPYEERSRFLDYLKVYSLGKISVEQVKSKLEEMQEFTFKLKVDIVDSKVKEIKNFSVFWDDLQPSQRNWILKRIGGYQRVPYEIRKFNWEYVSAQSRSRIIKNFKKFKTLLIKYKVQN